MKRTEPVPSAAAGLSGPSPASQTLVRGLDVLEMVATGPMALPTLANRLGLARSTTHRLATALLERRYLTLVPRQGYGLGPKLLELGACAQEQTRLLRAARPYMETLAAETLDTIHLCICDQGDALLLERIGGRRRLLPSLRIGERLPLSQGAAGCALLLDETEDGWRDAFAQDCGTAASDAAFVDRLRDFSRLGYAFDPAETVDRIRTVAAPVRGADGCILAAIELATASQYLDDARLVVVAQAVVDTAACISADLGWRPAKANGRHGRNRDAATRQSRQANIIPESCEIAVDAGPKALEAGPARVHDRPTNGAGRAPEDDLGSP
jgi:DNA-binding IclR family transcriptional regulator